MIYFKTLKDKKILGEFKLKITIDYKNPSSDGSNIASVIEDRCGSLGAKFEADHNLFGSNPFLPHSVIKWTPNYGA